MHQNIRQLLHTGQEANIKLALTLIKSQKVNFDFEPYKRLMNWNVGPRDNSLSFEAKLTNFLLGKNILIDDKEVETYLDIICQLPKLEMLYLEHCYILDLPPDIGNLTTLLRLDLNGNLLESLPDEIGNLPNLVKLNLDENYLKMLPETIGQLNKVWSFDADENQLESLPQSIGGMRDLQELRLGNNNLTRIPESIGQLKQLIVLDLYNNKISELPETIQYCTALEDIDLSGNPISESEQACIRQLIPQKCWVKF